MSMQYASVTDNNIIDRFLLGVRYEFKSTVCLQYFRNCSLTNNANLRENRPANLN